MFQRILTGGKDVDILIYLPDKRISLFLSGLHIYQISSPICAVVVKLCNLLLCVEWTKPYII